MINLPIPFIGTKRNWNKQMRGLLERFTNKDDIIIVDMFGGSGYCSLLAKDVLPKAKVVYNDYDYYTDNFKNMADNMKVMTKIRKLVNDANIKAGGKLPDDMTKEIINMLKLLRDDNKYIGGLFSSCLCFQFSTLDLDDPKQKLYNKLTKKEYDKYIAQYDNLDIVHEDWTTLYNKYKGCNNVVFILDPPYPMTYQTKYKGYSFLNNQLKIIDLLKNEDNVLLFTSEKSFILDCYKWKYEDVDNVDDNNKDVNSVNDNNKDVNNSNITDVGTKIKVISKSMNCLPSNLYKHDEILIYKLADDLTESVSESDECRGTFKADKSADSVRVLG